MSAGVIVGSAFSIDGVSGWIMDMITLCMCVAAIG